MMRSCKHYLISLGFLFLASSATFANEITNSAEGTINRLHDTLIKTMQQADTLGYTGRYEQLDTVVRESFDFPTIARVVLGQYWQDLTPDQQAHFIETFTRLSIANYASRFDGYNAEHFTYLSDKEQKKGRILVMTMFQTQKRDISFNYLLQLTDDSWRIINVVVDGVSDLSLKRSDYGAILKNEGFNGLVKKLQEKIELSEHSADETQDSSVES